MNLISFMLTAEQVRTQTKTVTRRLWWSWLNRGELLQAVVKGQGLRKGERVERLAIIRVKDVRREPLNALTGGSYTEHAAKQECVKEGFPDLSAREFVAMFCEEMGCKPEQQITRIEFTYETIKITQEKMDQPHEQAAAQGQFDLP